MRICNVDIAKSLHKVFLQEKPHKEHFDKFKQNFQNFLDNVNEKETEENLKKDNKILSPFHLLKQAFKNDSNTLNTQFYYELLHILGLEEQTENGTRFLRRCKLPESGSFFENTSNRLHFYNNINEIESIENYGSTQEERYFGIALELCIIWLNRILFLKLLEAQLIRFHNGDTTYHFLNTEKIKSYSKLDTLFFDVLAIKNEHRNEQVKKNYEHIPYLNSSLFEITKLEKYFFVIGTLDNDAKINLYKSTILKEAKGNKKIGEIPTLQYLLEFLDAYNFGSDSANQLQENDKILINSSVLGLIFEKINGYKEGSFFTPGYITMYMCRETIRRTVVEKFNKKYNWNCKYDNELTNLFNYVSKLSISEANATINSITICDPAVGSGHFLVSALNEMIAIKADLEILTDRNGKILKNYQIQVLNDELQIIETIEEQIFEYNLYKNIISTKSIDNFIPPEKQRVQEAIFHEKKNIIENCLFGVDINQNSVNITRLRLWIELLKNAYYSLYQDENVAKLELQTLPNIDINIKCGNSLIHRFPLNTDLSKIIKSIKYDISYFKSCVENYKHAENKDLKKGYEKSIEQIKGDFKIQIRRIDPRQVKLNSLKDELQDRFLSPKLLQQEYTEEQKKKINEAREKLLHQIVQLENEISNELSGVIYQNAFEWRFEFPEVLDSVTGEFIGFDFVVGNPPYGLSLLSDQQKEYFRKKYTELAFKIDTFNLFLIQTLEFAAKNGFISLIIPSTFLDNYFVEKIRAKLLNNHFVYKINQLDDKVFKEASVHSMLLFVQKNKIQPDYNIEISKSEKLELIDFKINSNYFLEQPGTTFNINEYQYSYLIDKLIINSINLKEIIDIRQAIKTGNDRKFITDNCLDKNYKPVIGGKEIQKWTTNYSGRFLNYGSHLACPRVEKIFNQPKILIRETGNKIIATYDDKNYYVLSSLYNCISINKKFSLKYLLALLNSNLFQFLMQIKTFEKTKGAFTKARIYHYYDLSIKNISEKQQTKYINLVDKIIKLKEKNPNTEIVELEQEIDTLVYNLYELTQEEIQIIENATKTK